MGGMEKIVVIIDDVIPLMTERVGDALLTLTEPGAVLLEGSTTVVEGDAEISTPG